MNIIHPQFVEDDSLSTDKIYELQYPFIQERESSVIARFTDTVSKEILVGKILLPSHDGRRDYSTRKKRHILLKEAVSRNVKFSPYGVHIGLRPILPNPIQKKYIVELGKITSPEALDERFEYIWFMHEQEAGQSIQEKIQRNVAILEPLSQAVYDVTVQADIVDMQHAWKYACAESLKIKYLENISILEKSLQFLPDKAYREETGMLEPAKLISHLTGIANKMIASDPFKKIAEDRIIQGKIKKGHGDLKLKNIWFSDYYRDDLLRNFKECVTYIDAIDFNDSYNTIDVLSEVAMLTTDLQKNVSHYDYSQFLYYYFEKYHRWNKYDDIMFSYYKMEKAIVNAYVSILDDRDFTSAKKFLWLLRIYIRELEDSYNKLLSYI